ncbi:MAG: SDR family oxidoreductase [Clostridiales Family XIII bacterium]|jgi:3-oxoacyl-[acyl-carrier protein] reductase|nr:SDR family oxidoreductase [Clostridiales Family XIII bacterium]
MGNLFKDKVVLVTGSGQGIGRAIALAFANEGAKLVTNNRKPGSTGHAQLTDAQYGALGPEDKKAFDDIRFKIYGDAKTTAQTIRDMGGEAIGVFGDIAKDEDAKKIVDEAVKAFGTVHILVNAAGSFGNGALAEITEAEWDKMTNIKPKGHFHMMKHVIPHMQKQGWGRILNASSKALMGDVIRMAHYCAANAGTMGLSMGAACEYYEDGITVNIFSPWARTRAAYEADYAFHGSSAVGELGEFPKAEDTPDPEAIAPFLLYLCTEDAKHITGTIFTLAGNNISRHQFPIMTHSISKPGKEYWTVEELRHDAPAYLLAGYENVLKYV